MEKVQVDELYFPDECAWRKVREVGWRKDGVHGRPHFVTGSMSGVVVG